jgi:acetolactate synthase-1/2/3 large subunit
VVYRAHERPALRRHQATSRTRSTAAASCYAELHTPDYDLLCKSLALPHARVQDLADLPRRWTEALAVQGPFMLEIDMLSIGSFKTAFAGPPTNTVTQIPALGTAK